MSIRSKIQALITAANAATGESDATLTDAVQTLVDGYGQGGGSGSGLSVLASGTYTLAEGTKTLQIPVTAPITGTPKEAYIYRDDTITGTESLAAFVLLDAPTEVTYDGKYFKGNAGFVDRYGTATISNPPTKVILSPSGSNGFSDGVLSATTTGANFKAGRYVWAIYGEASGGGGSSVTVEPLTVTQNGTTTAQSGKAYSPVTVNVQPTQILNRTAKLDTIFGTQGEFAALMDSLGAGRISAFVDYEFSGVPVVLPLMRYGTNDIGGMAFKTDGTMANTMGVVSVWNIAGTVTAIALMGGQLQDLSAYAPMIDASLRVYGTTPVGD